jgi:hypothetical protein
MRHRVNASRKAADDGHSTSGDLTNQRLADALTIHGRSTSSDNGERKLITWKKITTHVQ